MTLDALIMAIGAFVLVLPFLALPSAWDTILLVLAGIAIIALGIAVRRRDNPILAPRTPSEESSAKSDHDHGKA